MLSLTPQERNWLRSLQLGKQNQSVKEWLESEYFKESFNRALIIQCTQNFAVLFLKEAIYKDETKQKKEVSQFLQLVAFLKKMQQQGYLTFSRGKSTRLEAMFFIQDKFLTPKLSAGPIVLNEKGDYTENPELIHNQDKKVIYEGVRFDHDYFDLIQTYCTGEMIVSPDIKNALKPKDEPKASPSVISKLTPIIKKEEPKKVTPLQQLEEKVPAITKPNPTVKKEEDKPIPTKQSNEPVKPLSTVKTKSDSKKKNPKPIKSQSPSKVRIMEVIILILLIASITTVTWFLKRHEDILTNLHKRQIQSDSTLTKYLSSFDHKIGHLDSTSRREANEITNHTKKIAIKDTFYGIDVSKWNGNIVDDIDKQDDITFIICKATQGASEIDPHFEDNWRLIEERGLIRGAYHFYIASEDPMEQAEHFASTIADLKRIDIAPVLDVESGSIASDKEIDISELQLDVFIFLRHLEKLTGRKPIIYSSVYFANTHLKEKKFGKYPLWIADYTSASEPTIPYAWKEKGYKFWQKNASHEVENEKTDYDQFIGRQKDIYN